MSSALQLRAADGRAYLIDAPTRLGRDHACEVHLDDGLVSRIHATVWPEGLALRIRDEGSSNGTYFNGERLEPHRVFNLRAGDTLRLGHSLLTVELVPQPATGQPLTEAVAAPVPAPPSAAERAAAAGPPTVHMPAQPARRRAAWPALALGGCAVVCLLLVCGAGGLFAVQRPPFLQTALAQLAPGAASGGASTPAATLSLDEVGLTLLPTDPPATPLPPAAFVANQQSLAAAVAALNQAQIVFIHKALAQAHGPALRRGRPLAQFDPTTDEDFARIERQALKVYLQADQQGQTLAAQGGGNDPVSAALADVYATLAQQALVVALKVDNLHTQWVDGTLDLGQVAALMAQASAVLWNPAVTEPGGSGNPFALYAGDPAAVANPVPVDPAALTITSGEPGLGPNPVGWVAVSPSTGTETLSLPPSTVPTGNVLSPAALARAAEASGAILPNLSETVIAYLRFAAVGVSPNPASVTVPKQSVAVADPQAAAASGQGLPAFPNGQVTVLTQGPGSDDGFLGTVLALDGTNTPTVTGQTPIESQPAVVTLTLKNLSLKTINQRPKDAFNTFEADVVYEFDVDWTSSLIAPQFELDCVSGNHFDITTPAGTQHISAKGLLILYPGAEDAYCYASRNGNTLGSASLHFLVGDPAAATQRAIQVETDSVSLDLTLTADALGTQAAGQTQAASTLAVEQTASAVGGEVAGTQTAEFILTVTALAGNEGPFATQTAAALSGDADGDGVANANDRCADQAETANGWRDEDGCPDTAPSVNLNLAFTEELQNGPLAAFASNASLVINFGLGTTTGTLNGGGSWDGTYNCFNTSNPSDIYQIVDARYTGSYTALVTGTADQATRTYQGTLTATGRTNIRLNEEFTHPECTHLNGVTTVDNWTGAGTVSGTWDGNTFAALKTEWRVDDIGFFGTGSGTVTLTEP